jgi:F0F1-type ATP synthase membrane subunit b/b'
VIFAVFFVFCLLVKIYVYPFLKKKLQEEQDKIKNLLETYAHTKESLQKEFQIKEFIPDHTEVNKTLEALEESYQKMILEKVKKKEKEHRFEIEVLKSKFYQEQEAKLAHEIIDEVRKSFEKTDKSHSFSWALNALSDFDIQQKNKACLVK